MDETSGTQEQFADELAGAKARIATLKASLNEREQVTEEALQKSEKYRAILNKMIRAARLKEARTISTGISNAVTETVMDLIDWAGIKTVSNLQEGSWAVLESAGIKLDRGKVQ